MRVTTAVKAFFAALFDREKAEQIELVLSGQLALPAPRETEAPAAEPPAPPAPVRSDAVTLLAALQREARLVDLIHEDLDRYSDEQVGAAARPCLKHCATVLDRLLGPKPLLEAGEGETVEVAGDASPLRFQWVGEGTAATGKLVHHGWRASKVELPAWTGRDEDANVITPAQVQAP